MKSVFRTHYLLLPLFVGVQLFGAQAQPQDTSSFVMTCDFPTDSTMGTCTENTIGSLTLQQTSFRVGVGINLHCFIDSEASTLTAADGSVIYFRSSGPQCDGSTYFVRKHDFQITGGTGEFAGATGSGTYDEDGYIPGQPARSEANGTITLADESQPAGH